MSPVSATYLGIPGYVIFWVLFAIALALFLQRSYFLYRLIRLGKPENRSDKMGQRIRGMALEVGPQLCNLKSVTRKDVAGLGHAFMFWGFSFFFISYIIFIGFAGGFGLSRFIESTTFETVYFSILDIAGVLVALSIIFAAIRRYIVRPPRLEPSVEAAIIMVLVFSLMVLNVGVEGFGYASQNIKASWPPLGAAFADYLNGTNISQDALVATYRGLWWLHYIVILGFMYYIPRSKHLHILTSPINAIFKPTGTSKVILEPVPLEETATLGVSKIDEFKWKDLLDLYSCAVCGRCHVNCPAQLSGKSLSPREVILNLKEHLLETGHELLAAQKAKSTQAQAQAGEAQPPPAETQTQDPPAEAKSIIGDVIKENDIWACTTCGACQEACPVDIEHVRKIIGMRRNLVLVQNRMPETAQVMLRNLQSRGSPWAGVQSMRLRGDWTNGQELKILADGVNAETLFWVGCTGALVERNVSATLAMTRVLKAAGIDFGVFGDAEVCCGDPARRAGYDFQFQLMAEQNIQAFKDHGIKEIITACPHCYNALKNEYPQYGGNFKVTHYTQIIADLIKQGKIKLTNEMNSVVTYQDPCYLGRYNGVYQEPRQILKTIPNLKLKEMELSKSRSFCCGGGGGHMWIEEEPGTTKINQMRTDEAEKTGADTVVTACPYCLQMFEEGIDHKNIKDKLKAKDLIEVVEAAMVKQFK